MGIGAESAAVTLIKGDLQGIVRARRLSRDSAAAAGRPAIASIHEKRASLQATIKAMGAGRQGAPIGTSAAARPIVVGQCQLI